MKKNIVAHGVMYALGMYFDTLKIPYQLQLARLKYECFKGRDRRKFKNLGPQKIADILDDVKLRYQNQGAREIVNHRWYTDEMRQWLIDNEIDKFDDIADTILILQYHKQELDKSAAKSAAKASARYAAKQKETE